MNIWTRNRQQNGTGNRAIVTQQIRVQHGGKSDEEILITWPDCLSVFDADELERIIDGIMVQAARKVQAVDPGNVTQTQRAQVAGVLVSDPGFWQRVKARVTR